MLATLSTTRTGNLLADGATTSALTSGYHLAFAIGAALVVTALALTVLVLHPERQAEQGLAPAVEEVA